MAIWKKAGIDPVGEEWYISAGQGMGASINIAAEEQAYIMTDKATYLSHEQMDKLTLLLEKADELKNTYTVIAVSAAKWKDTNVDGSNAFIKWMQSEKAQELIASYGVKEYGEALFYIK